MSHKILNKKLSQNLQGEKKQLSQKSNSQTKMKKDQQVEAFQKTISSLLREKEEQRKGQLLHLRLTLTLAS